MIKKKHSLRLAKAERTQVQLELLQKTLLYLSKHSPFYQSHFSKHSIDIHGIRSFEDLSKIPTIDKADLHANEKGFWCVNTDDIIDYCSTSGTEGKPITVPLTKKDLERLAKNEREAFLVAHLAAGDTIQLTTTIDRQFMAVPIWKGPER